MELSIHKRNISFNVDRNVFGLLKAAAENRNLRLQCLIRDIVFRWIIENIR